MLIIPIGHEHDTVRRLPWITFTLMAICVIAQIFITSDVNKKTDELMEVAEEFFTYYLEHPYLELSPETREMIFGEDVDENAQQLFDMYRQGLPRSSPYLREEEQAHLDELAQRFMTLSQDFPYRKWGYIPTEKSTSGLVTYMFVHGGLLHLLGNLLLLYLMGPFIEDKWGRPLFLAFYLIAGIFSALMYGVHYPNFSGPLIGASGAIAGIMGAFLIKYWNTKINFFYWFFLFFRGTFQAPAFVMLPLWFVFEILNARAVDAISPQSGGGGVAHWAHVWGFVFGLVVALGIKSLKIEEKYLHPKIEAKVVSDEERIFEEVGKAIQKNNVGRKDEAYAILHGLAEKHPLNRDIIEVLWQVGAGMSKAEEAAGYYINLLKSEIRREQLDMALKHYRDIKEKYSENFLDPNYVQDLAAYAISSQDFDLAKELVSNVIEEFRPDSSSVVLQKFADIALKIDPIIAGKIIELCLQHPEIPPTKKELLKNALADLQAKQPSVFPEEKRLADTKDEQVVFQVQRDETEPMSEETPEIETIPLKTDDDDQN
jgi:membrane associated rhomboid family serine protease